MLKQTFSARFSRKLKNTTAIIIGVAAMTAHSAAYAQCGIPPNLQNQISGPAEPAEAVNQKSVLPSTLVKYVHTQNYLQPEWDQQSIAWPLLPLAKTENLSDEERFFWGQLNFMSFKAEEAYEIFSEFKDRDDWYGWMARQRHAIMETRAFEDFEKLEKGVKYERKNFAFKPEFADITGFGERSLCTHWAETGEHDRAVKLAKETLAKTPRDAAYNTLYLAGTCFKSFSETGREQEAFEIGESVRQALSETLEARLADADSHPPYDPELFENIIDDRWYGRSQRAPYNFINYNLERMIEWYEAFLACRRDGDEEACKSVAR